VSMKARTNVGFGAAVDHGCPCLPVLSSRDLTVEQGPKPYNTSKAAYQCLPHIESSNDGAMLQNKSRGKTVIFPVGDDSALELK
jgi:hypothetical protein